MNLCNNDFYIVKRSLQALQDAEKTTEAEELEAVILRLENARKKYNQKQAKATAEKREKIPDYGRSKSEIQRREAAELKRMQKAVEGAKKYD